MSKIKVFRWTEKNSDFINSDIDGIGIGCGENNYGLFISNNLANGSTDYTDTFDNELLSKERFKIKKIEVTFFLQIYHK